MWSARTHRVLVQVHGLPEGLRVLALEDEVQQLLAAAPPGLGVVGRGPRAPLPLHGTPALRRNARRRKGTSLEELVPRHHWGTLPWNPIAYIKYIGGTGSGIILYALKRFEWPLVRKAPI